MGLRESTGERDICTCTFHGRPTLPTISTLSLNEQILCNWSMITQCMDNIHVHGVGIIILSQPTSVPHIFRIQ